MRTALPPAGVFLVKVVGARRPGVARSSSGRRRQGRRWLGMASYGLSAGLGGSAPRTHGTQRCSPRLFTRAEEHTQRFRLGLRDFTMRHSADSWALPPGTSLTQECVQHSLLALSGYAATTGTKADKTRTRAIFKLA